MKVKMWADYWLWDVDQYETPRQPLGHSSSVEHNLLNKGYSGKQGELLVRNKQAYVLQFGEAIP